MAPSQIVRIPCKNGSFILGEVTPTGSGSKPLNIKLVATEGEAPYVVKLKHDRIGDLRVTNSPCSPGEWENILKAILLNGEPVEGIEAGAEVHTDKSIIITVRRLVAGISQRLGSITLNHKADEEVNLFDWCGAAVLEREKFREDIAAETAKAADLEARVAELRKQLDELTQAKKAREKEILRKMCQLLNEKKVKIREQQRLLRTARVDDAVKLEEEETEDMPAHHVPTASRPGKRKTRQHTAVDEDESSDDGFEKMDIDPREETSGVAGKENKAGDESADERLTSDEHDEDETGSEPDEDEDEAPVPPPRRELRNRTISPTSTSAHTVRGKGKETSMASHPRRKDPSPTPADGDETESDDEL